MQSGITASADLHNAFTAFTSDDSQFCLPINITSESLTPLPSIAFSSSTFSKSLSSLDELLTPTTPLYLLLRKAPSQGELVAVTYIPSRAPVRQKTLFASTRATLVRELGSEKFAETIFLTEREEILDPAQWHERAGTTTSTSNAAGGHAHTGLLSTEERELQAVKRAEEEERHGTRGRDLMGQGGSGAQYTSGTAGSAGKGIQMKITDEAKSAIAELSRASAGTVVQLGIEISTETLTLSDSKTGVSAGAVVGLIPSDRPSYTFYSVENGALFLYVCPGTSKVKERMVYASSRRGLLHVAETEGVKVLKRLEAGGPDELGGERIEEEVKSLSDAGGVGAEGDGDAESAPGSGTATPRGGFARPKRPGGR
ncbi:Twinfilin-1 [Elasticomyces elasticus]|uniref:Twinfilin-1 n=1 Tax=Exophiala sideris TaxID=1016849 RepID=A0ABR0IVZ8_9EURO|nr:Twinfilin-1 [Elasticomyces elasticus]KAK5021632.1 Twinfilin-1 [Exophiala sideris]KAK5024864.1 Twinfilin-1 [Exophiala sideris]KAK5049770.1 Twinfilin-1 [Exophiala sideris]KAK5176750.1 Twinfilin-1 [Eurotiomycetes sp. CCFEE 6388]